MADLFTDADVETAAKALADGWPTRPKDFTDARRILAAVVPGIANRVLEADERSDTPGVAVPPAITVPPARMMSLFPKYLPAYGCTSDSHARLYHRPIHKEFSTYDQVWGRVGTACGKPLTEGSLLADDLAALPARLQPCRKCYP